MAGVARELGFGLRDTRRMDMGGDDEMVLGVVLEGFGYGFFDPERRLACGLVDGGLVVGGAEEAAVPEVREDSPVGFVDGLEEACILEDP